MAQFHKAQIKRFMDYEVKGKHKNFDITEDNTLWKNINIETEYLSLIEDVKELMYYDECENTPNELAKSSLEVREILVDIANKSLILWKVLACPVCDTDNIGKSTILVDNRTYHRSCYTKQQEAELLKEAQNMNYKDGVVK